ncbi:glycine betaine ABC transporter substrate-binding protein [Chitinispirillales bacterium ANBcel5]|uniref:glycine betaine ABC transporter substrate-binding protein n=1 Tax=Cellulosispirillum alkaliphilum TaxID=3039283 RepID=UPI002A52998D|nr:glycine betaine ABC transporter substrate-binding protein [Chitinispirillales bacterium ANBcel5]
MRRFTVAFMVFVVAFMIACPPPEERVITIAYVERAPDIATTNLVAAVMQEQMGIGVNLISSTTADMWEAVATGEADAMVSAWLPTTDEQYLAQTDERVVVLSPILEGTRTGLVVPQYVEVESIEDLDDEAQQFDNQIIGVEPDAGIMVVTERAMQEYELEEFQLVEGSDDEMTSELESAIEEVQWIVVTGMYPHWMFEEFDLEWLEDPEGLFGENEFIASVVRINLSEEMPDVYQFLDNFSLTTQELQQLMQANREPATNPYENAVQWIQQNETRVQEWIPQD